MGRTLIRYSSDVALDLLKRHSGIVMTGVYFLY